MEISDNNNARRIHQAKHCDKTNKNENIHLQKFSRIIFVSKSKFQTMAKVEESINQNSWIKTKRMQIFIGKIFRKIYTYISIKIYV